MIESLVGKIFGDLTIKKLDNDRTKGRKTYWICECICGNNISIRADTFKTRVAYHCGCRDDEYVFDTINNFELQLLEIYYLNKVRRIIFKDKNGYKGDLTYQDLVDNDGGFNFVDNRNPYTLENIPLWLKINNRNFELLSGNNYFNSNTKLKFHCFKCTDDFFMDWEHISQGYSCNLCAGKYIGKYNNLEYSYPNLAKEWIESEHNLLPSEVTFGCSENVCWQCSNCNHQWWATVNCRTNKTNKSGCPKCNESKAEKTISEFLENNDIFYQPQYRFKNCKYKNTLPFDFYVPNYNLCIEAQGPQHYEPIDYFGGENTFQERLIRDQIKRDYCYNNQVNLLEIPYWEFKNIESILVDYLNL